MTEEELRTTLKNIRSYYAFIRKSKKSVVADSPSSLRAKEFRVILATGPPAYLFLFEGLYIDGKSQKDLMADWGMSRSAISRLHSKMIDYLLSNIKSNKGGD